jgi:branched-subunit amino acid aminotransferase/4-amino-4-deoxychorismate lyase
MSEKIYLNGHLVSGGEARVSVSNPSFLHGVGLFETLRTYNGKPFRLAEHLERLRASAQRFNMPVTDLIEKAPAAVDEVLAANNLASARVRITVTPPGAMDEVEHGTLLVRAEATTGYPPELYERGMTVCVQTQYRQSPLDPLAGHKTTSYFPRLLALRDAQDKQCGEALWFTPDNFLAEGCMSSVFLVHEGKLLTPPLDTPILPGVTRAAVIELADEKGILCEQRPCTIDDLLKADEVFLTNAIMEVLPVTRVERHLVNNEKIGAVTRTLAQAYKDLINST